MNRYIGLIFFTIAMTGCQSVSYGQKQGQRLIDSLISELNSHNYLSVIDTNRIKLIELIADDYQNVNTREGMAYCKQGLELSQAIGWVRGEAEAYKIYGDLYAVTEHYPEELKYYLKAYDLQNKIHSTAKIASLLILLGDAEKIVANYDKALAYYYSALNMNEEIKDPRGIIMAQENLSLTYFLLGDSANAKKQGAQVINAINERIKKEGKYEAYADMWEIKKIEKGLKQISVETYCAAAKKYSEQTNDVFIRADLYTYIGTHTGPNGVKGDTALAFQYLLKAINLLEAYGYKNGIEYPLINMGNEYSVSCNFPMASLYFNKTLALSSEIDDQYYVACCYFNLADIYLRVALDDTQRVLPDSLAELSKRQLMYKAKEGYGRGINIFNSIGTLFFVDDYIILSQIDSLLGNYKDALEDYKYYTRYRDSSVSLKNGNGIAHLEAARQALTDSLRAGVIEKEAAIKLQRQQNYTLLGFTGILLLVGFSFFIVKERRKSERLLLNILPATVAAELKAKGASDAKLFNDVTVLFSDFVGFTKVSELLSPKELVDELNICFKTFDNIMGKHNIEKIKTIGDAYLAVCGLPAADPNHAERTIRAAIEINSFMKDRFAKLGNKTFEIRIGVHSGNVVAGIVGVKKFAYDIWGDAVNTAARMEQNSTPGRINVSESTYELVKDKFTFEYRGEIDAKNKGMLKMYYVSGL